jgi:hypothetical protein
MYGSAIIVKRGRSNKHMSHWIASAKREPQAEGADPPEEQGDDQALGLVAVALFTDVHAEEDGQAPEEEEKEDGYHGREGEEINAS